MIQPPSIARNVLRSVVNVKHNHSGLNATSRLCPPTSRTLTATAFKRQTGEQAKPEQPQTPPSSSSGPFRGIWKWVFLGLGLNVVYKVAVPSDDMKKLMHKIKNRGSEDLSVFRDFKIVHKEYVSPTCSIFTVRPEEPSPPGRQAAYATQWLHGLWSVEFKQPQLQIARSYTPLPPTPLMSEGDLRFLIRREHKGEVSNYLAGLPLEETIHIRGPKEEFEIPEHVREVVFLAGGTGIAPALQAAHTLLRARTEGSAAPIESLPRIHVMWANRRREECAGAPTPRRSRWAFWSSDPTPQPPNALVRELNDLESRFPGRFSVEYLVDEEESFIDPARVRKACGSEEASATSSKLMLVAGPDGFVQYFAGPRALEDGREVQGPIGGQLARLALEDWTIVKL